MRRYVRAAFLGAGFGALAGIGWAVVMLITLGGGLPDIHKPGFGFVVPFLVLLFLCGMVSGALFGAATGLIREATKPKSTDRDGAPPHR